MIEFNNQTKICRSKIYYVFDLKEPPIKVLCCVMTIFYTFVLLETKKFENNQGYFLPLLLVIFGKILITKKIFYGNTASCYYYKDIVMEKESECYLRERIGQRKYT